jgi:hypothetical protein
MAVVRPLFSPPHNLRSYPFRFGLQDDSVIVASSNSKEYDTVQYCIGIPTLHQYFESMSSDNPESIATDDNTNEEDRPNNHYQVWYLVGFFALDLISSVVLLLPWFPWYARSLFRLFCNGAPLFHDLSLHIYCAAARCTGSLKLLAPCRITTHFGVLSVIWEF